MSASKSVLPSIDGSLTDELEETEFIGQEPDIDHARIERAVREILLAVGEDPDREGLLQTPARVDGSQRVFSWERRFRATRTIP